MNALGCLCACICLLIWAPAVASPKNDTSLQIVTDMPITHSLVSMVMGDTGSPTVLMEGSSSPHNYSLRPSEAARLQSGMLLVWTSRQLTPWLANVLRNDNQSIDHLELMSAPDTIRLAYRNNALFSDNHDHRHDHQHNHSDGARNDSADDTPVDPHGWLDPVNAIYWLELIAQKLSAIDPQNATIYQRNAQTGQTQLRKLQQQISKQLAPVAGRPFIVFHDSYHYFEDRFSVFAKASITLGDADAPGIRRMNALRDQLRKTDTFCLFTEPQFSNTLVRSLTRDLDVSVGSLDPIGAQLPLGQDLYPQVLSGIANELSNCLSSRSSE